MAQEIRPAVIRPPSLRTLPGQKQFSGATLAAAVARGDEAVLARAEDGSVAVAVARQGEMAIAVAENRSTAFASCWQGGSALALAVGDAEASAQAFVAGDALAAARRVFGNRLDLLLTVWLPPEGEAGAIAAGRVGPLVDCLALGSEGEEPPAAVARGPGGRAPAGEAEKAPADAGRERPRHVTRRRVHPVAPGEEGSDPALGAIVRDMDAVLRQFESTPNREAAADLKAALALLLASVTG